MMGLIKGIVLIFLATTLHAQTYTYEPTMNACTRQTPAASLKQIVGNASLESLGFTTTLTANVCLNISVEDREDGTYLTRITAANGSKEPVQSVLIAVENPSKPGQFQMFMYPASGRRMPSMAATIIAYQENVGYAIMRCLNRGSHEHTSVDVYAFPGADAAQIADLNAEVKAKLKANSQNIPLYTIDKDHCI